MIFNMRKMKKEEEEEEARATQKCHPEKWLNACEQAHIDRKARLRKY